MGYNQHGGPNEDGEYNWEGDTRYGAQGYTKSQGISDHLSCFAEDGGIADGDMMRSCVDMGVLEAGGYWFKRAPRSYREPIAGDPSTTKFARPDPTIGKAECKKFAEEMILASGGYPGNQYYPGDYFNNGKAELIEEDSPDSVSGCHMIVSTSKGLPGVYWNENEQGKDCEDYDVCLMKTCDGLIQQSMLNVANFQFEKTGSQRENYGIPSLCDRIVAEDDSVKYCPPARYSGPGQIPIYTKTDWDLDGSTFVHRHSTCMACGNCDCPGDTPAPANDGKEAARPRRARSPTTAPTRRTCARPREERGDQLVLIRLRVQEESVPRPVLHGQIHRSTGAPRGTP